LAEIPEWIWVGAGMTLLVVIVLASRHLDRRRSQALEQAALRLGMAFQAEGDPLEIYEFRGLPLFQRGRSRKLKNVASAGNERFFGYSYTTGSGKSSSTHVQTVAVFSTSRSLPRFELRPEGFLGRIGSVFRGRGIGFEEDPGFSRAGRLKGPDETAIRQLFQPALRQQLAGEAGWSVEGDGHWLALYRHSKRIRPDQLVEFIESARRIAALFH
jgi:hypothetical protein